MNEHLDELPRSLAFELCFEPTTQNAEADREIPAFQRPGMIKPTRFAFQQRQIMDGVVEELLLVPAARMRGHQLPVTDQMDLVDARLHRDRTVRVDDPESLANVIQAGTSGNWPSEERDEISGQTRLVADEMTGSIGYYNGSFVIRQTHQVHEEIAQLLDNLAEQITSNPPGEEWSFPTSPSRPGEKPPPTEVGGMCGRGSGFY